MPELPSLHAFAALVITGAAFVLFIRGRLRIELICLLVIGVLAIFFYAFPIERAGTLTGIEVAFGGFGHPALVAICCLMILGRGLVMTGALEPAARVLARLWRFSHVLGMLCTLLVCMLISGFVNDTPVLVLMLPILLNLAQRAGVAASKTLMPVNLAILIGGMATTIGTSTNVLIVSIAADLGVPPIGDVLVHTNRRHRGADRISVSMADRTAPATGTSDRRPVFDAALQRHAAHRRSIDHRRQNRRRTRKELARAPEARQRDPQRSRRRGCKNPAG